jgi:hypothetical protein
MSWRGRACHDTLGGEELFAGRRIMATAPDNWYVRLPDGRTLRARTSDVLRNHLQAGRFPVGSEARRSGEDTWQPLAGIAELAEALPTERAANGGLEAPRSEPKETRAGGVRGLAGELLGAFDRSLDRAKLGIAAVIGLLLAVGAIAIELVGGFPVVPWGLAGYGLTTTVLLAVVAVGTVLLTQMTYIELDRRRPARAAELRADLVRQSLRVFFAQGLVAAVLIGMVLFFRAAGPWLAAYEPGEINRFRDMSLAVLSVARLLLEVLCWPLLGMAVLLLGPLLVIEEHSILRSLREWLGLLRRHIGRIYLCEALALTLATVLALPMLLLVAIARYSVGDAMGPIERITLLVLCGVALTPLIAYLIVANVFIYLNIRYEFSYAPGE